MLILKYEILVLCASTQINYHYKQSVEFSGNLHN